MVRESNFSLVLLACIAGYCFLCRIVFHDICTTQRTVRSLGELLAVRSISVSIIWERSTTFNSCVLSQHDLLICAHSFAFRDLVCWQFYARDYRAKGNRKAMTPFQFATAPRSLNRSRSISITVIARVRVARAGRLGAWRPLAQRSAHPFRSLWCLQRSIQSPGSDAVRFCSAKKWVLSLHSLGPSAQ